jgi:sugar lactone lactonase YvrE
VPGYIYTSAGSAGSGVATSLGQLPYSLAVAGTHLYIGDVANPVVRDLDTTNGQESVLAGNDGYGYTGDGGPAVSAMIDGAGAIARCGTDTFFADTYNYVIRKIDNTGNLTRVAGTGRRGYSGDGGPGTLASISRVLGLGCYDNGQFLYISDSDNRVVRTLDRGSGTIDTLVTGFAFPTGVLADTAGNVFMVDSGTSKVWRLDGMFLTLTRFAGTGVAGFSGDNGPATAAQLNLPWGLAFTFAGGVYGCQCYISIADRNNNRVRVVDPYGVITTLAGTGTPGSSGDGGSAAAAMLDHPAGLGYPLFGSPPTAGAIYVADTGNFTVRKIDMTTRVITTIAGNGSPSWSGDGGQASAAQLGNPYAVAFDGSGNEYIADNQNNVIRKITPAGVISTVAGNALAKPGYSGEGGLATNAQLNDPRAVAVTAAGDILISDTGNQRVRWIDHTFGTITTIAGNGIAGYNGDGPATGSQLNYPQGVAIDSGGKVYIADTGNNRVRQVGPSVLSTYAGNGTAGYSGEGVLATGAMLNGPRGLAVDGAGNLYISDANNNRVRKVTTATGFISTIAGNGAAGLAGDTNLATSAALDHPFGLAFDAPGNLYIGDTRNQRIRLVDTSGIISAVVATCGKSAGFAGDGGPASIGQVNFPYGLGVDASGSLFIADVNNNRIRTASALAAARPASCPSPSAGAPTSRGAAQTSDTPTPPTLRLPRFDRPETARSSTTPTTPLLPGAGRFASAPAQAAASRPPAQAAASRPPAQPPAVVAPAGALRPAVATGVSAAPPRGEISLIRDAEPVPALTVPGGDMMAASRAPAIAAENGPGYAPLILIPLAIMSLTLLVIRRRKNRRLIGHSRP